MKMEIDMPNARNNKPPKQPNYLKRRTFEEGNAQVDAAHVATWRLYCEVLSSGAAVRARFANGIGAARVSRPAVSFAACRACRPLSGSRRSRK